MVELIDKLTEKIYQEGVEKAKAEGKDIIAQANTEKDTIIARAKKEAASVLSDAKQKAEELKKSTETDIRMSAQKSIATIRQRIEKVITATLAEDASEKALKDTDFVKKMIEKVVEKWDMSDQSGGSVLIKLSAKDIKDIEKYFTGKAKQSMNNRINFEPDTKIKAGFVVEPSDGSFKIGFSDKDFTELFQFFLRPRIRAFLFGSGT